MTAKPKDQQQNRASKREHLTTAYLAEREVENLREIDESIASRSLGRSYNRHLNGSFGYVVDCTPEVPKSTLRAVGLVERSRRSGRCRTVKSESPIR